MRYLISYTLYLVSYILHIPFEGIPYILYLIPCTLYRVPLIRYRKKSKTRRGGAMRVFDFFTTFLHVIETNQKRAAAGRCAFLIFFTHFYTLYKKVQNKNNKRSEPKLE